MGRGRVLRMDSVPCPPPAASRGLAQVGRRRGHMWNAGFQALEVSDIIPDEQLGTMKGKSVMRSGMMKMDWSA